MTDYVDIPDSLLEPEKPVTNNIITALRDNPKAIAEGAPGAPDIELNALPAIPDSKISSVSGSKLVADSVPIEKLSMYSSSRSYVAGNTFLISPIMYEEVSRADSYQNTGCYFECKYDGTIKVRFAAKSDTGLAAKARVLKNNSVELIVFSFTGTVLTSAEGTFSVSAGDFIVLQIGDNNSNATCTLDPEYESGIPTGFYIARVS